MQRDIQSVVTEVLAWTNRFKSFVFYFMERCIDWIHRQTFGTLLPLKHIKNNHVKKEKRKPDANSSQNHFLIGLNPYIFMKWKYFWNTYTKSVWNETVEACEPLCYIIKMLHVLNTKGWNKDRDIFEDISDLSGP